MRYILFWEAFKNHLDDSTEVLSLGLWFKSESSEMVKVHFLTGLVLFKTRIILTLCVQQFLAHVHLIHEQDIISFWVSENVLKEFEDYAKRAEVSARKHLRNHEHNASHARFFFMHNT